MKNPFSVVKDFEDAVAEYTGAPYCVAVNSCTNALFLCLIWVKKKYSSYNLDQEDDYYVTIPRYTYISVPMQCRLAGYYVRFRDEKWSGAYQLAQYPIWDSARRFTSGMFPRFKTTIMDSNDTQFVCTSHHWSKILGIQQGGCILHNNYEFDKWARRARFDGRTEGVAPKDDKFKELGWHMYMSPEIAAEGLVRLHHLPKNNPDLPNDDYPDLSKLELFK